MTAIPNQRPNGPNEILLVEDNPGDVRLTREALDATTHETTLHVVTTGTDAIEFLRRRSSDESRSLPDLVLLDLNLPGMDGCDMLDRLNEEQPLRMLPVIVLTSSGSDEDIARCYDAHANAYLTKPSDHGSFVSLIEAVERFWFDRVQLPPVPS